MIVDSVIASTERYDLCVIGSGPAGIILALEYAALRPDHNILLMECGSKPNGTNPLDETVDVKTPKNHHLPYECTNKGIGGSSLTWGGRCVMYDEIDFLPHGPVQEECTWDPSFLHAAKPFFSKSADYFDCGEPAFNLDEVVSDERPPIAENFKSGKVIDNVIERWSLPTRFGKEYGERLRRSASIRVLEGFRVTHFSKLNGAAAVTEIQAESLNGECIKIQAGAFVISAGGQESTRLLLKSPQLFRELDTVPATLGKYYQGHVSGKIAFVRFHGDPNRTQYGFHRDAEGIYCRQRLQFSTEACVREGLLNIAFWTDNPPVYDASHGNGTLSFIYLAMITPILRRKLLPPAIARSLTAGKTSGVFRHLLNVVRGLPGSLLTPAVIFVKRYLIRRGMPGVYLKSRANRYALHFHAEQIPLPENEMRLSEDDKRLEISYRYSDEDVDAVIKGHQYLDQQLRAMNCGELEYLYEEKELPDAIRKISMDGLHQVGTTRIADSPRDGVVDRDLRVWGTSNLYVCSSSVFPTSGQANPTFFLGACAARLASHVASSEK